MDRSVVIALDDGRAVSVDQTGHVVVWKAEVAEDESFIEREFDV